MLRASHGPSQGSSHEGRVRPSFYTANVIVESKEWLVAPVNRKATFSSGSSGLQDFDKKLDELKVEIN